MKIKDTLINTFERAAFLIDGRPIHKSDFINRNVDIIVETITNMYNKRKIILHPGTSLFFYLSTVLASFASYMSDDTDKLAFIDNLSTGDLVIYQGKRGEYKGKDDGGRIVIENRDKGLLTVNRVPRPIWNSISPYNGEGRTLDGRGLRRRTESIKLLSNLFGLNSNELKSVTTKGVVVVCERSEADRFMARFNVELEGVKVPINELYPSAFYTIDDIHYYPGNSARVEPLLKFTSKLSVARKLIIEDNGNEILIVNGSKFFTEDISEIASIYNRNSLKSILFLGELWNGVNSPLFSTVDDLESVIWTKGELKKFSISETSRRDSNKNISLQERIANCSNCENRHIRIESTLDHNLFASCKTNLYELMKQGDSDDLKAFVIKANWLLNLLERSFFPLSTMERLISEGRISALSPTREIDNLYFIAQNIMNLEFQDKMLNICTILRKIQTALYHENPKFDYLLELIQKARKSSIAVVMDKTYYQAVFFESVPSDLKDHVEYNFYTPNKFSSDAVFSNVVITGITDWKRFNPFLLSNTHTVTFMLYPNEEKRMRRLESQTHEDIMAIRKAYEEKFTNNEYNCIYDTQTIDSADEIRIETELEEFVQAVSLSYSYSQVKDTGTTSEQNSEVKRVAILETGEKIFFTKHYNPYVFDSDRQVVVESDVMSLARGDMLVFTNYDSDTRDVVERIMDIILDSDNCDEHFRESHASFTYWKARLKEYLQDNKMSFRRLSEKMGHYGKQKHEVTLKSWLDDGSHIIGPRDRESFQAIANITKDPIMLKDPDLFFRAFRDIRSMRVRILKYIGRNIIQTYNRDYDVQDEILNKLPIDLSKMSRLVEIEEIVDVKNLTIASHLTNRPHNL
ncbi:DrmE family protein [Alicyclobacillus sp. SP_1]|uniref:DrmE family protein n=1 Tax=Alicyclobacillus sp. SP_1 TaxID=2942475 RepID=UPI002157595B|nr:DrmE family protein [Alicyclobacillus sp. SP_1]